MSGARERLRAGRLLALALRAFDVGLQAIAAAVAISLLVTAWHDVSQAYDVWYYHLPFAARLVGIMDASTYAFSPDNVVRFQGFPLLGELIQGIVWRVTGKIEATNLVAVASLFGLVFFLRRLFRVPAHLSLLALVAIPLVHIHATSSYVDLPGNACATMLLLCVYRALLERQPPSLRFLVGCAALAAVAANTKFQLVPIVTVAAAVLLGCALRGASAWRAGDRAAGSAIARRLVVFALALPVVFATPIKNTLLYGNPVWPVELRVLGRPLPFREEAYAQSPPHLAGASRPVRFLHSVLELDNLPIETQRRWSLDQWAPPDHPSCRMGGYFGAYVVANLAALGFAAWRWRPRREAPGEPVARSSSDATTREVRLALAVLGGATVVAALVPQSHELRYYMFWMLLLVSLVLVTWTRAGGDPRARAVTGGVAAAALAIVAWSTSGVFLYPSGSSFAEFLAKRADRGVVESTSPGERICVQREPFTFLYAPTFHPHRTYAVQEATSDADCLGARHITP